MGPLGDNSFRAPDVEWKGAQVIPSDALCCFMGTIVRLSLVVL